MNLKTVPKGDMALGYDVAKKYSSPKKHKRFTLNRRMTTHTERDGINVTCFVFSERDDEIVVMIDESRKGAGLCVTHTHTPLHPGSR